MVQFCYKVPVRVPGVWDTDDPGGLSESTHPYRNDEALGREDSVGVDVGVGVEGVLYMRSDYHSSENTSRGWIASE